jgi:hypothetical protein
MAMAKLKDDLPNHQSTYKVCSKDLCEEQLQNLETSNLDSYAEYARGIQEKLLLVRMRKEDIQQTFANTHGEAETHHPTHVDDDQTPPPHPQSTPASSSTTAAYPEPAAPSSRTGRQTSIITPGKYNNTHIRTVKRC